MERIADALPRSSPSRTWPLLGMLALGLVAGYAVDAGAVAYQRLSATFIACGSTRQLETFDDEAAGRRHTPFKSPPQGD
jgi:hypothetical protein